MPAPNIGFRDHVLGALLAVTYVLLLVATSHELGMSRDEGFYVRAAESYAGWFRILVDDPSRAIERPVIDQYWAYNAEHPALMKSLFAWSWLAQEKWQWLPSDSMAFRLPGMVSAGLLLWLLYIFGARLHGRKAGAMAALLYALLPRPFYHAHLDCFDVPIAFMVALVTYCYWRSLQDRRWAGWLGVAFGLALATKHNSWVLPGIFAIHWTWMQLSVRRPASFRRMGSRFPWWLLAMVTISPVLFLVSWPWVWPAEPSFDPEAWQRTVERLNWYAAFHLEHVHYNMAYFGRNYFEPPLPISFPWVMTFFTVPLTTLALVICGLGARLPALIPRRASRRSRADRWSSDVLILGCFLAPLVAISLPWTPIFGGTKHWFTGYPFMCLIAGAGFQRLLGNVPRDRVWLRLLAPTVSGAVMVTPAAIETHHSHPFGLSHYTMGAGFVPGSADHGMNRQFWGFTTGSLVDFFRRELPNGGTVWICDTVPIAWQMLQRDGRLPANIRATGNLPHADFAIVHHEHHFAEVDFQIWEAFGSAQPVHVLTYDGVPIISVYRNPRYPHNQESNRGAR